MRARTQPATGLCRGRASFTGQMAGPPRPPSKELKSLDEGTRQQITWVIITAVVLSLLALALYRRAEVDLQLRAIAQGLPAERVAAVTHLIEKQKLPEALEHQPRWVQDRAVEAASMVGTEDALFQLVAAKGILDAPVAETIDAYVTSLGESAVGPLVMALQDKDAAIRGGASAPLQTIGEPAVSSLMSLIDVYDEAVRGLVSSTLGGIGEPAVRPLLRVMQQDEPAPEQGPAAFRRAKLAAEAAFKAMKEVALEPVIDELLVDEDAQVRLAATGILGAVAKGLEEDAAAQAVPPLIERLERDEAWAVRRKAASALGGLAEVAVNNGAVEPLIAHLGDPRSEVRASAAAALGALGDAAAAEPLANLLLTNRKGATAEIADALEKLGQPSIAPLTRALEHPAVEVRLVAAQTIAAIGTTDAVVPLGGALDDPEAKVRRAAADALRNLADQRVLDQLAQALGDSESAVYYAARDALARMGEPALQVLIERLGSGNTRVAYMAQQALAQIGEPAIDSLVEAMRGDDPGAARWAGIALGEIGEQAVEHAASLLNDAGSPTDARVNAAGALGRTRSYSATEPLTAAAQAAPPAVRAAAIKALGEIGDERATSTLVGALTDDTGAVRDEAMLVLLNWRLGTVDDDLNKLLSSDDEDAARRAAIILAEHTPAASGELIRAVGAAEERAPGESERVRKLLEAAVADESWRDELRSSAIGALRHVGTEASLDSLKPLLAVGSKFAAAASKAVGSIGQRIAEQRSLEGGAAGAGASRATKLLLSVFETAESRELRLIAGSGLAVTGSEPVAALIKRVREGSYDERTEAVAVLGAVGKPAVDPLLDARGREEDREIRNWLAVALVLIGDARAMDLIEQLPKQDQPDQEKLRDSRRIYGELQELL